MRSITFPPWEAVDQQPPRWLVAGCVAAMGHALRALLPRRWRIARRCAWVARVRRLARAYDRVPAPGAGLPFVAFACLMVQRFLTVAQCPSQPLVRQMPAKEKDLFVGSEPGTGTGTKIDHQTQHFERQIRDIQDQNYKLVRLQIHGPAIRVAAMSVCI